MATATVKVAAVTAKPLAIVHPPSSPFSELLRRSRFASFDPAIRQTYSSHPSNAHRGDWGLKRPIALRRKNAFISLGSFEHPAHFTEWNHAENQVRFIRRIEEMGMKPETVPMTPWHKGLAKARTQWLLDSEFCHENVYDIPVASKIGQNKKTKQETTVSVDMLGKQGPGAYGAHRAIPVQREKDAIDVLLAPNINAMTRRQFIRYLRHMRSLRPAFKQWIESNRDKPRILSKSLFDLSQKPEAGVHRRFLQEQTASEFNDINALKFEPNPHPNAGLLYSRPSPLDTAFRTRPQPGFVLNPIPLTATDSAKDRAYAASFGGLAATLHYRNSSGKLPLLDTTSETGIEQSRIQDSITDMRLVKKGGLILQQPPRVVGRRAQGLKAVSIDATITTVEDSDRYASSGLVGGDNPYPLGTAEYVAADPVSRKSPPHGFGTVLKPASSRYSLGPIRGGYNSDGLINTLKKMIPKQGPIEESDEGL